MVLKLWTGEWLRPGAHPCPSLIRQVLGFLELSQVACYQEQVSWGPLISEEVSTIPAAPQPSRMDLSQCQHPSLGR